MLVKNGVSVETIWVNSFLNLSGKIVSILPHFGAILYEYVVIEFLIAAYLLLREKRALSAEVFGETQIVTDAPIPSSPVSPS
jgi:hypothetical protein